MVATFACLLRAARRQPRWLIWGALRMSARSFGRRTRQRTAFRQWTLRPSAGGSLPFGATEWCTASSRPVLLLNVLTVGHLLSGCRLMNRAPLLLTLRWRASTLCSSRRAVKVRSTSFALWEVRTRTEDPQRRHIVLSGHRLSRMRDGTILRYIKYGNPINSF